MLEPLIHATLTPQKACMDLFTYVHTESVTEHRQAVGFLKFAIHLSLPYEHVLLTCL